MLRQFNSFSMVILIFSFFLIKCSTVEFIPSGYYRKELLYSHKENWKQIEILAREPEKPHSIYGKVIVRNFEGGKVPRTTLLRLQQELFDEKMDGCWLKFSSANKVQGLMYNEQGNSYSNAPNLGIYKSKNMVYELQGFAFRYED